jgi:hypothetical protein
VIYQVEKRRFRQNGVLRETRCYHLRYRLPDMPVDWWKSLGVTDKQVAEKLARGFIQEKEREAAGILEPRVIRDAAKKPLKEHLEDYVADLQRRGRSGRGGCGARLPVYEAIKGLPRLLDHTQIRAQISGAAGQNVAQAGAASEGKERAETPINGGFCRTLAHGVAVGKMERAKGFELWQNFFLSR